jgi:hypothetical protein
MHSERDSFPYPGGLPYDEGQAVPLPRSLADRVGDASMDAKPAPAVDDIDRPLDELIEERAPRRGNIVRGRGMRSDGELEYVPQRRERSPPMQKLYLLSEVDAVIHHKMVRRRSESATFHVAGLTEAIEHPPLADRPRTRWRARSRRRTSTRRPCRSRRPTTPSFERTRSTLKASL